MAEFKTKLHKL